MEKKRVGFIFLTLSLLFLLGQISATPNQKHHWKQSALIPNNSQTISQKSKQTLAKNQQPPASPVQLDEVEKHKIKSKQMENQARDLEQQVHFDQYKESNRTWTDCSAVLPNVALVPMPRHIKIGPSCFTPTPNSHIHSNTHSLKATSSYLSSLLSLPLSSSTTVPSHSLSLATDSNLLEQLGPEGYRISVKVSGVEISAANEAGIFHATQTLRLMLPEGVENGDQVQWAFREMEITDWPVYSWRGMHLDVSRHFFPASFVKKFIDLMALHKMNRFHWHLTDDQGWRIPIPDYPKLTQIGGYRHEGWAGTYGGSYTTEEILDVIQYAQRRFITVVPEIEMPGHAQAAIAAYPHFGCPNHATPEVWTDWGVSHEAFCAGNHHTIEFLQNILSYVISIFPSKYIHVGGDECDKTHWRECDLCQEKMRKERLETPEQLQAHFTTSMSKFLAAKDRRLVGWDEILEGGVEQGATVMSWRGVEGGIDAAARGLDAVMTPQDYVYLDRSYSEGDHLGRFGTLPLRKTYQWEPVPEKMEDSTKKHILGGQGNVWSEGMRNEDEVEYLSVPRMSAIAEVLWSPSHVKGWQGFTRRMKTLQSRLDTLKVNYHRDPSISSATPLTFDELTKQTGKGTRPSAPSTPLVSKIEKVLQRDQQWYSEMFDLSGLPV